MKTTIFILSLLLSFAASCVVETDPYYDPYYDDGGVSVILTPADPYYELGSDLTVINDSSYDFYELSIAEIGDAVWSENFLGGDALLPDEQITLENIACGVYDVLIIDDTEAACVLEDFSLCDGDNVVTSVTDYDLAAAYCD